MSTIKVIDSCNWHFLRVRIRICFGILFHYEIYETFGHVWPVWEFKKGGVE